ncbi:unnamed protein product [Soboliphyme baturini]|uniref:Secreted protein n=1 Tax=Soboliphyme baturini TaxID=241478 RepID=A0A183IKS7_9BILA|nr:unnamed protein product [Soboliphyme baturini]
MLSRASLCLIVQMAVRLDERRYTSPGSDLLLSFQVPFVKATSEPRGLWTDGCFEHYHQHVDRSDVYNPPQQCFIHSCPYIGFFRYFNHVCSLCESLTSFGHCVYDLRFSVVRCRSLPFGLCPKCVSLFRERCFATDAFRTCFGLFHTYGHLPNGQVNVTDKLLFWTRRRSVMDTVWTQLPFYHKCSQDPNVVRLG